jgi:NAD(P)-dependent dehydrogenase (short-subunit alcohol dehydrogenase family)
VNLTSASTKKKMEFTNKTAIVTGAGQGIGFEICKSLANAGANVILNDIDPGLTKNAVSVINSEYSGACTEAPGDSSDLDTIKKMVELAIKKYGRLDIVVANAGITLFGDFLTYSPDAFKKVMQVNLAGTFFLAQASANQMKDQPGGGSILFISSVTGHQAHKNLAAYGMSKAALEMLAKNLVIELSEYKINVNAIAPGATVTERTMQDPSYHKIWSQITPLGRPAMVQDIADTALFLVSGKARHITGQTLVVDGGWSSVSPSPD